MILDIEYEFLFDNFKWFSCYLTFDNTSKERIDIFLCYFIADDFFIILFDGERRIKRADIGIFVFSFMPSESSLFCFLFCEREIIMRYSFIISKRGERYREKFAPLSCWLHMVDDFPDCVFIFGYWIGLISDTVFLIPQSDATETILTGEALFAVEEVSRMKHIEAEKYITDFDGPESFETPLWSDIHIGAIHHILHFYTELDVFTILRIRNVITLSTIFWIDDEIPDTIFWIEYLRVFYRESTCVIVEKFFYFFDHRHVAQSWFSKFFLIVFFWEGLIFEMVFFIHQIRAHKTITTSSTVFHKVTIAAIFGIYAIITPKAFFAVKTLVEHLRIIDIATIDDIFWTLDELPVVTSLAVFWRVDEVTIFAVPCSRCKFWVFISHSNCCGSWDRLLETRELLKKCPISSILPSIVERIPLVWEPFFSEDRFEIVSRSIESDYGLTTESWFGIVEFWFVSMWCSPPASFVGTECRCRDTILFPTYNGWNSIIERHVTVSDMKFLPCKNTFFCLDYFFIWWYVGHRVLIKNAQQEQYIINDR